MNKIIKAFMLSLALLSSLSLFGCSKDVSSNSNSSSYPSSAQTSPTSVDDIFDQIAPLVDITNEMEVSDDYMIWLGFDMERDVEEFRGKCFRGGSQQFLINCKIL